MENRIRIGVSACVFGQPVRFDGSHKHDRYLTGTLGEYFEFVPVCPEVEAGFPVPRETFRLVGDPQNPRLVTTRSQVDHTERMVAWAEKRGPTGSSSIASTRPRAFWSPKERHRSIPGRARGTSPSTLEAGTSTRSTSFSRR